MVLQIDTGPTIAQLNFPANRLAREEKQVRPWTHCPDYNFRSQIPYRGIGMEHPVTGTPGPVWASTRIMLR